MSILIVGGSQRQTEPIKQFLENKYNKKCETLHTKKIYKNSSKNPSDFSAVHHLSRVHFLAQRASKSFSCYFSLFIRKEKYWTLIYRLLGHLAKRSDLILSFLQLIINADNGIKSLMIRKGYHEIVIFCGLMTTKTEKQAYIAARKGKSKIIYWPHNWDNVFGKLNSSVKFDHVFCWGAHMRRECLKDPMFGKAHVLCNPRLTYLKKSSIKKNALNSCFLALSQKQNAGLLDLLKQIELVCSELNITCIVRPHPDDFFDQHRAKHFANKWLKLDTSFEDFLEKKPEGGVPALDNDFLESSNNTLKDLISGAKFAISEGSTICLEARTKGMPVVVLANNLFQVTARNFIHLDHFRPLAQKNGIFVAFDTEWGSEFIEWYKNLQTYETATRDLLNLDFDISSVNTIFLGS